MKKLKYETLFTITFVIVMGFEMVSCSNDVFDDGIAKGGLQAYTSSVGRSLEEALAISHSQVLGETRSDELDVSVEYILRGQLSTRSDVVQNDTLAYVINYSENSGFSIISKDKRIRPVLAYSNAGHLSLDNPVVKESFIDRIEPYVDNVNLLQQPECEYELSEECVVAGPNPSATNIGQYAPYNKYLLLDYPDWTDAIVGCVPVATAIILMNTKDTWNYRGKLYIFSAIREAIAKFESRKNNSSDSKVENGANKVVMSYMRAIDEMSQLLYQLGKDMKIDYARHVSGAYFSKYSQVYREIGWMTADQEEDLKFVSEDVATALMQGKYIWTRGYSGLDGHAWVIDRCQFCWVSMTDTQVYSPKKDIYFHCDWGWHGNSNGYFTGDVFSAGGYNFKPTRYLPILDETAGSSPFVPN